MTRPIIWTPDILDVFEEIWLSDALPEHLSGILEARTGLVVTYGAMLSRAHKMSLGVRKDRPNSLAPKEIVERYIEPARVVRGDTVRLVKPGTFKRDEPFTMLRAK